MPTWNLRAVASNTETSEDAVKDDALDLYSMTKAGLLDYAAENGVQGVSSRMTKAQIIAVIENE